MRNGNAKRWTVTLLAACAMAGQVAYANAAEPAEQAPAIEVGSPSGITLDPGKFDLIGPRSRQQLLVTGQYGSDDLRDLTSVAVYESSDAKVVKIENTVALPVGNGTAKVTAKVGNLTAAVDVTVRDFEKSDPISFKNETLAALTKAGCNMGACHGSPSGKAGFRLSLRAYDPALDMMTLRQEFYGRRTNTMNPAESLLLKKPLMEVAHGGGRRLKKGDPAHQGAVPLDRRRNAARSAGNAEPAEN